MEIKYLKNNFTGGRFSPLVSKRSDYQKYKDGLAELENFIVMTQGGITSRTGSKFVSEVKDSGEQVRLIPFKYNTDDALVLAFGPTYIRFYQDGGLVLHEAQSITGITQANPAVVTYSGADNFTAGDHIYISGVVGMTEVNDDLLFYTVGTVNTGTNTFTLLDRDGNNVNSTGFTAYASSGSIYKVYQITTLYAEDDLFQIDYSQSGNVLFLTHKSYPPQKLTRNSALNWEITEHITTGISESTPTDYDLIINAGTLDGSNILTDLAFYLLNPDDYTSLSPVQPLVGDSLSFSFIPYRTGTSGILTTDITTITRANPGVITRASHGFSNGDEIYIGEHSYFYNRTAGDYVRTMPEINKFFGTGYTVVYIDANNFSLSQGGVPLDTTAFTAYIQDNGVPNASMKLAWKKSELVTIEGTVTAIDTTPGSATLGRITMSVTNPTNLVIPSGAFFAGSTRDLSIGGEVIYRYPDKNCFFQQRFIISKGESIFGSEVDDYTNFTVGLNAADPFDYTIANGEVSNIKFLTSNKQIRIGTENGISTLWGGGTNIALTPTNAIANIENNIRCKEIKPVNVGNTTIFSQRTGKTARELFYDYNSDGLISPDLTILSEDILGDKGDATDLGIVDITAGQEPYSIVLFVKDNGEAALCSYDKDQGVIAFSNIVIEGGEIESSCIIPTQGEDRIWVVVKRTINSITRRYIEQLDLQFRNRDLKDAIFHDSSTQYTGTELAATLTLGAVTGTGITCTAGAAVFASTDVGRYIVGDNGGKALITAYTSTTVVTVNILFDFPSTTVTSGAWNISVDTISGLDYLEGVTVSILADGSVLDNQAVTSGEVDLGGEYNTISIGIPFNRVMETLDIDFGSAMGTAYGAKSKASEVFMDIYETRGGTIGPSSTQQMEIDFLNGNDINDQYPTTYTGFKRIRPIGGWKDQNKIRYENNKPWPVTILSMVIKGEMNE